MSVLIEAHSIIVRCDAIHERHSGGWEQFITDVPNRTLCSDGEIARVGFMSPSDAEAYINHLEWCGLRFWGNGKVIDVAAVFQQSGLEVPCDWLEFGRIYLDNNCASASVAYCRLQGGACRQLTIPARWKYEGSLSQTFGIFPSAAANTGIEFIRHENGVDVYYDSLAEKEVFVGRTGK
jgi:hypothetical protein